MDNNIDHDARTMIEESITRQLTPEIVTKLALKGISESEARMFLRHKAIEALMEALS